MASLKPIVLIVMDGVGAAVTSPGNAVTKAKVPFLEKAWDSFPHTILHASGEYVGLPMGIKGNSEVGHMNLGSGRIVFQELPRINRAVKTRSFFSNSTILSAFSYVRQHHSRLHVAVCFSDAGVHGTIDHLEALVRMAAQQQLTEPLIIHAFTDGRDSPPQSAATFLTIMDRTLKETGVGSVGSVMGRYYAMDRNSVWERVQKAYDALTLGAAQTAPSWHEAIQTAYDRGETDEFITPTIIKTGALPDPTVHDTDAFILLNYRADRAIELTTALTAPEFPYFTRQTVPRDIFFVGMTEYAKGIPANVAFPSEDVSLTLGRILSENDQRQLRIAESEKFPHVTYFFNGGRSIKFSGEDRMEIPSPTVATYDKKPEMSIREVTQAALNKIALNVYDFVLINFANGDMVGHTGVFEAGKLAMSAVDHAVEQIVSATRAVGGCTIITADHGNVEEMLNPDSGEPDTEHSINPVPFIFIPPARYDVNISLQSGALPDVAPTILRLMGLNPPSEMRGKNLLGKATGG